MLVVGALVAITMPSYASTYPDEEARVAAVDLAQTDGASTLLYGRLPNPGTPGQLFVWEMGAFITLLVAVLGLLVAVRLTRAAEQEGTIELVRTAGVGRLAPLSATLVLLAGMSALLGLASAAGVGFTAGRVDGVNLTGALTFGAVVALSFLLTAMVTVVVAQLVPTAWSARVGGALMLTGSFAARAAADTQHQPWLNWLTPLGLRATVQPFTSNRALPLVFACCAVVVLATGAIVIEHSRELGSSLARASTTKVRHLNVTSPFDLAMRLDRATTAWWVAGIAVGGALFTAMGSSVIETARQGRLSGGFLEAQLAGGDPVAAYLGYTGTIVAIVVAASGILAISRAATEERHGPGEYLRATGTTPTRVLAGHLGVALTGTAMAIAATASLIAVVARHSIGGPGVGGEAFDQVAGQWSGVLVILGPAVLVAGCAPRLSGLGWIPYAAGLVLALLGSLLGVPHAIVDLGPFHLDDGTLTQLARVSVFALTSAIGLWAVGRRDLTLG